MSTSFWNKNQWGLLHQGKKNTVYCWNGMKYVFERQSVYGEVCVCVCDVETVEWTEGDWGDRKS